MMVMTMIMISMMIFMMIMIKLVSLMMMLMVIMKRKLWRRKTISHLGDDAHWSSSPRWEHHNQDIAIPPRKDQYPNLQALHVWLDQFPEDFMEPPNFPCLSHFESFCRWTWANMQRVSFSVKGRYIVIYKITPFFLCSASNESPLPLVHIKDSFLLSKLRWNTASFFIFCCKFKFAIKHKNQAFVVS